MAITEANPLASQRGAELTSSGNHQRRRQGNFNHAGVSSDSPGDELAVLFQSYSDSEKGCRDDVAFKNTRRLDHMIQWICPFIPSHTYSYLCVSFPPGTSGETQVRHAGCVYSVNLARAWA